MTLRPMCRLCLVVTGDEDLAREARQLTLPNSWIAVVCGPESLTEMLDSFLVRHIVLDARSVHGDEVTQILAAKARSVPVSRSNRPAGALALLANVCAETIEGAGIGRDTSDSLIAVR